MAISLAAAPNSVEQNKYYSGYNPIRFKFSSGVTTCKRMKLFIYVGSSIINANSPIIQDEDFSAGSIVANTFTFDVSKIVNNYLSEDFQTINGKPYFDGTNAHIRVGVKATEVLENATTKVLSDGASLDLGANYIEVLNSALQYTETQNSLAVSPYHAFADFELGADTRRFLTNMPLGTNSALVYNKMREDESQYLSFINPDLSLTEGDLKVITYNSSGSVIAHHRVTMNTVFTTPIRRVDVAVGLGNFANLVSGDMSGGTSATILTAATVKYTVGIIDDGGDYISQLVGFEVDRNPKDYNLRFHWLNRLGGIDSFTFYGANKRSHSSSKNYYHKNLDYAYSIGDTYKTVMQSKSENRFEAWTDIQSEDHRIWLEELMSSPRVMVQSGTNYLPIIVDNMDITTVSYDDNVFQVKIDYSYSFENVIQYA